jgi:hypothetical protein
LYSGIYLGGMDNKDRITYFAETDARNQRRKFGIKEEDRSRHVYVIGKTGMGKSTLLENMAVQDIQNGEGMAFMDPHGKTAELLLNYIPEDRLDDVIYFAPFDTEHPISFNVMEDVDPSKRFLVASGLMSAFKHIWVDAWSARMEYILNNTLLALLEYPGSTLLGVNRMLSDKAYRKKVVDNVTDPAVKSFWVDEFAKYGERYMQEAGASIQNKVGQFVSNPLIRNVIGQPHTSFNFRQVMDEGKILIVNLSKGQVGESNANLLGSMIITSLYVAALSRADVNAEELEKLPFFYFYVDEFQSFANESFADILSEARKYKLNLTIAHQYIDQMTEEVRQAVFGNVGTMITFRVGANDAEVLEKEFAPTILAEDIVNLGFVQIYLKLMIDGISSPPFSARTLPPIENKESSHAEEVISRSRKNYTNPRSGVEEKIFAWHEPLQQDDGKKKGNVSGRKETSARPPRREEQKKKTETVSLDSLKKNERQSNSKVPKVNQVNDLKKVLENIQKPAEVKKDRPQIKKSAPQKPVPGKDPEWQDLKSITLTDAPKEEVKMSSASGGGSSVPEPEKDQSKNTQSEVPEDVLKSILDSGNLER